jgi:hypothetical protein
MNWTEIYITGKEGFSEEVIRNLRHADIPVMPGSTGHDEDVALFWVDEKQNLRDFKKAIGSKTIFKYRLRFYRSLEELYRHREKKIRLTDREQDMIREMHRWESLQKKSA